MFPNILSLIDLLNTIPASSADAERGFNRHKTTKSDWRSKLVDQLYIMLESPKILEYDPLPTITLWNQLPRRIRYSDYGVIKPTETVNETLTDTQQEVDKY
jgi:hypothetical protein